MASSMLSSARPSATGELRDTVLLFSAIHRRDAGELARLLAARPALAEAREDWTPTEAAQARIGFSQQATALIRAAETGVVELAELLVGAGASVDGLCDCDGGETPLWAASIAGQTDMVEFLLSAGADPNATAFRGATPLHAAVMRDRTAIVDLLLAAGADPGRTDEGGRSPADWAAIRSSSRPELDGEWLWTGIRALDLFAPVRRGSLQWWPAAVGLGQFILTAAIPQALGAEVWYVGFDQRHVDASSLQHGLEEAAMGGHINTIPRKLTPAERRRAFGASLAELRANSKSKVVVCLVDDGHRHDIEVVLPGLRHDPSVLTTIVVEHFGGQYPTPVAAPPEGYDAQIFFDRRRAWHPRIHLFPAIEPLATRVRCYPSQDHADLAEGCRELLARYYEVDPELELQEKVAMTPELGAAPGLIAYLGQHLPMVEPFTSQPAERTGRDELMNGVRRHLSG